MKYLGFNVRLALLLGVLVTPAAAQRPFPDTSAAEIALLLRTKGMSGGALKILMQEHGPQPKGKLDAIADTLTEIAISYPGDSIRSVNVRYEALQTLAASGRRLRGIPYTGAAERLAQIALSGSSVRGGALYALTLIVDRGRALQLLRQVATSRNAIAYAAVGHLARDMGAEGLALARQLYLQDSAREPNAREELERMARYYKWQ